MSSQASVTRVLGDPSRLLHLPHDTWDCEGLAGAYCEICKWP